MLAQESRLLLGPRNGDAKHFEVFVNIEYWFGGDRAKKTLYFSVIDRHNVDSIKSFRFHLRGQQLNSADKGIGVLIKIDRSADFHGKPLG